MTVGQASATGPAQPSEDGRRARRERNRLAVIDAMFELLQEQADVPSAAAVAERAGVSVSSVFRYFEDLDDLQQQTIERYFERFAPLFDVPDAGEGQLPQRIQRLVEARLALYEEIAPIARLARQRAPEHQRLADTLHETRARFAEQVRQQFASELQSLGRAVADDRLAVLDTLLSFESWDLLRTTHDRSRQRLARAWTDAITRLLSG